MKDLFKAAIIAFGVTGALAAMPASAQPYDDPGGYDQAYGPDDGSYDQGYGDQGYGDQEYVDPDYGYCDPDYGCPDDYYDLPLYYGQVYYGGSWYPGPLYYRDYSGGPPFLGGWR